MKHLDDHELSAFLDGALSAHARAEAERHLASCPACREALARLTAQDDALKSILAHDPGEAYFESFAGRVADRVRAAGLAGAQAQLGRPRWATWLASPRRITIVGAVAAVVAGTGIVLLVSREAPGPALQDRELSARLERAPAETEPAPAAPNAMSPPATPGAKRDDRAVDEKKKMSENDRLAQPERAPAQAMTMPQGAASARLQEMHVDSRGEETPVRRAGEAQFANPPPAAPIPAPGGGVRVRKQSNVVPLQGAPPKSEAQQEEITSGSASSKEASSPPAAAPSDGAPSTGFVQQKPSTWGQTKAAYDAFAKTREGRLCGDVRDSENRPVAGAQVVVADVGRTTQTDAAGRFCLSVPEGDRTLSVMAIGFGESRQQVHVAGEASEVRLALRPVEVLGANARGGSTAEAYNFTSDHLEAYPDSLRRIAGRAADLAVKAQRARSARDYDAAAAEWERVLKPLMGTTLENQMRYHVAESRFHAWELGGTRARAATAREALNAYLANAPRGAARDLATRWLEQVTK